MLFRVMGEQIVSEIEKKKEENQVYTLALWLSCDCAFEYIDESGRHRGFFLDLAKAVCREAGRKCVYQVVTQSECITHQSGDFPHAGKALLGKQVDMCLGWLKTSARKLSLGFTEPLARFQGKVLFVVKAGNPHNFDPNDITGKTIGFENGVFTDKTCLLHAKDRIVGVNSMHPHQEVYKENLDILLDDLRHDRIDSFLTLDIRVVSHLRDEFEFIGDDIGCILDDAVYSIKRKDSQLTWFDETLRAMRKSGKYHALCHQARQEHDHKGTIVC
ncbi:arginine-binding periplasmic protein-like [Ptychodera flava]|uniref:arginine-binding periplasmic protein-like n=1 Tax=Ptychodera flava TaxID=63121 RepID=UPI00396A0D30